MAYQVLARKWRPQKFEDVIGQDHVVRTLQNAIKGDRLAHAYLFTGVRGVGKTSIARILAKALNCEHGPTPTPDNTCKICAEITGGSSVDVLEIDGASNTGVEDVRNLRDNVRYLPQASRYKIYIIDEVHMLSNAAFNALLKTLEEPPPHVIFIFATTEPHKILPTILSRCQRFDFRRIPGETLVAALADICKSEGVEISTADLRLVAREAEGSMRDSLSLLDRVISYCGKKIPNGEVAKALGVADRAWISEMAEGLVTRDAKVALGVVRRAYENGYDLREMLRDLVAYLRHMAVVRVADDPAGLIDLAEEEIKIVAGHAARLKPEEIQIMYSVLSRVEDWMGRASDPKTMMEMALIQALQATPAAPVEDTIAKLELIEKRLASGGGGGGGSGYSPKSQPTTIEEEPSLFGGGSGGAPARKSAPASGGAFSWKALLELAHTRDDHPLTSLLENVNFVGFEDGVLTIEVKKASIEESRLKDKDNQKKIELLVSEISGGRPRLRVESRSGAVGAHAGKTQTDRDRAVNKEARDHPRVKDAQEIFGATVKEVRPAVERRDKGDEK